MKQLLISIGGAIIGGTLGYFGTLWLKKQGYYGMILPGGLLGIGASFGKTRSIWFCVACAIAALGLGMFSECTLFPWKKDGSLGYFLRHVTDLEPVTLIMIAVGAALGFWMPYRHVEERNLPQGK